MIHRSAREGKPIDVAVLRRVASAAASLRDRCLKSQSETDELIAWARDAVFEPGFPESATKFFWTVMAAQIEFYPDHDQRVSHAVFHTAGRLVPMARVDDAEVTE